MRTLKVTTQFKKGYKLAKRDPRKDLNKLQRVIDLLQQQGTLPADYLPHPLVGNWRPAWECHIQPDFLLIYELTDSVLRLIACGSHADLFD